MSRRATQEEVASVIDVPAPQRCRRSVAGRLTPVPGGAGPMTIALLMVNTLRASSPTSSPNFADTSRS
ncbi:hypothetical protein ACFVW1_53810 [Streptomyces olivochromogenes]|uniref:hypothetical protein n=1 Tax=Streptomyces olivochromogenes TaxID=1963 RepID=UPI0036DF8A09